MTGRRRPGKRERAAARIAEAVRTERRERARPDGIVPITKAPKAVGGVITVAQASAVKVYARDYEAAQLDGRPMARLAAQDGLKAARACLSAQEIAILDLVAGNGRGLADIAAAAGRPKVELEALFLTASSKLADHYEARAVEPI